MTQVNSWVVPDGNYSHWEQASSYQMWGAMKDTSGNGVSMCPFSLSTTNNGPALTAAVPPPLHPLPPTCTNQTVEAQPPEFRLALFQSNGIPGEACNAGDSLRVTTESKMQCWVSTRLKTVLFFHEIHQRNLQGNKAVAHNTVSHP